MNHKNDGLRSLKAYLKFFSVVFILSGIIGFVIVANVASKLDVSPFDVGTSDLEMIGGVASLFSDYMSLGTRLSVFFGTNFITFLVIGGVLFVLNVVTGSVIRKREKE